MYNKKQNLIFEINIRYQKKQVKKLKVVVPGNQKQVEWEEQLFLTTGVLSIIYLYTCITLI